MTRVRKNISCFSGLWLVCGVLLSATAGCGQGEVATETPDVETAPAETAPVAPSADAEELPPPDAHTEVTPAPEPPDPVQNLVFVGDVAFTWRDEPAGAVLAPGEDPFREVKPLLSEADFTVANMEGVLVDEDPRFARKSLNLWAKPIWAPSLVGAGIDLVSHANNHAFDGRSAGVFSTRRHLEATGVAVMGSGASEAEARAPFIYAPEGLAGCVAIVPATLGVNRLPKGPGESAALALYILNDAEDIFETLAAAKARCPIAIPYIHWGPEYLDVPIHYVRRLARRLIEAGASMVVGHHPHVLQGVRFVDGRPIVFSLGNFVFSRATPTASLSGVLRVAVRLDEEPRIESFELVPVVIGRDYVPRPAVGRDAERVRARMEKTSRPFGTRVALEDGVLRFSGP